MTAAALASPVTTWVVVGRWPVHPTAATAHTKINTPDLTDLVASLPADLHQAFLDALADQVQQQTLAEGSTGT